MRLQGPGDIEFREVRYGDEAAVAEILADWEHGTYGARLDPSKAVHKWVNDMRVEPGQHPCPPDYSFRQALIAYSSSGEPMALVVYVVRGANDPKNFPLPVCALYTECFAIAPNFRDQGRMDAILNTLIRSAFEDTGADVLIHDLVDTAPMRSHQADRAYSAPVERDTSKGRRIRVQFTKAEHEARMAANPAESTMRHVFEPPEQSGGGRGEPVSVRPGGGGG